MRQTLVEQSGLIDESVRGHPAPPLRPYVAWYSGYRQRGVPPTTQRGLPSPYLTLILTLDDPLILAGHCDPAQPPGSYLLLLGGLHTSPALVTHDGRQSGVQIALSPLGARALLGLPAGELGGLDLSADDVLGPDVVEAHEALRLAADWPGRFSALDAWLLRRAAKLEARPLAPEVGQAWRLLLRTGGTAPVASVVREIGWSPRRLSGRFNDEIGLSPKAAARVIRFDRARRTLAARVMAAGSEGPGPGTGPTLGSGSGSAPGSGSGSAPGSGLGLADLAVACGYFDQAHLDREFRALAGCPPVRWVAEEFRNIQAGAHFAA
ncbi:MAG TPA: helix-turn-helix domain-containing protein [Actinocrinis sp.]|nr:helix-turn-helix domain-containing protein [Actinocrinis sp.]